MDILVRDATEADLPDVVDIYNQAVLGGWSTADNMPVSTADRLEWFRKFDPRRRPLWVAETDGRMVGWIGLTSLYGGRPGFDATAEVATYIATAYHGRGVGTELKRRMIAHCPRLGVTRLLSTYFDHNLATARVNARLGFERVGCLPGVAVVGGRVSDLILTILRIPSASDAEPAVVVSNNQPPPFSDPMLGRPG